MDTARALVASSVVGVLDDIAAVERVMQGLAALGISEEDVTITTREGSGVPGDEASINSSPVGSSAATGAAFGGLLGGLAGWMISIGAIAIPGVVVPGVGAVFGAGALAATLTGLAVGAAAGGLAGGLLGLGVPETEAKDYAAQVTKGRVLVTIHGAAGQDISAAAQVLEANGGYDVHQYEVPVEVAQHPHEQTTPTSAGDTAQPANLDEAVAGDFPYNSTAAPSSLDDLSSFSTPDGTASDQAAAVAPEAFQNTSPSYASGGDLPQSGAPLSPPEEHEGDLSAQSDTLGTGAEGGYGSGLPEDLASYSSDTETNRPSGGVQQDSNLGGGERS